MAKPEYWIVFIPGEESRKFFTRAEARKDGDTKPYFSAKGV